MSQNPASTPAKGGFSSAGEQISNKEGEFVFYGLIHYAFGYKFFVSGVPNVASFFPYEYDDEKSRLDALDAAKKFVVDYGLEGKIKTSMNLWILKDDIIGRDVSEWQTDAHWSSTVTFGPGFKEVVAPSMDKLGLDVHKHEVWGKLMQVADPSGYTKEGTDRDGNPVKRAKLIDYIAEVYASKEACQAAFLKDSGQDTETQIVTAEATPEYKVPDGINPDIFKELIQVIREDPTETNINLSKIYETTVPVVVAARKIANAK